jgi:citrate lyase subunit beta/citryl-CoA lyase
VANAATLAAHPAVTNLALGVHDLALDLGVDPMCDEALLYARSALVVASRAAGIDPPVDGVHAQLDDDAGLERAAHRAAALGFYGKSAVHPRQLAVLHQVFTPTAAQVAWAERVVRAFEESAGAPTRLERGEFVDRPVAERARRLLTAPS